jgi:hypothetical protein
VLDDAAMVRAWRRLLLLGAGLCLASCLSPTLPLPPPDRPAVSTPDENGLVRLQGVAAPRAEVIAWNHNNNLIAGQVTGDDSRYDFTIPGKAKDFIELWYVLGTDESQTVRVTVPEPKAEKP